MKLYLISQSENVGYDTFDSAIVAAETEGAARVIHPSKEDGGPCRWREGDEAGEWGGEYNGVWAYHPSKVSVTLIGHAVEGTPEGVILASFNAG